MVSMFLPFFGHIHLDGFDCEPCAILSFSEVDELFRHAESSYCTGWCFLITVAIVPASILILNYHWLFPVLVARLNKLIAKYQKSA